MIGRQLAHYTIVEALGAGGMGQVYRATDSRLGRDVALKVLPAHVAASQEHLDRFRREARALAALDHPAIVTVFSVEEAEGIPFLTMQLVDGESLERLLCADGLSIARSIDVGIAVAEALASAHDRSVVHRDLKPANVMIAKSGQVKVLDFGLAKMAGSSGSDGSDDDTRTNLATREGVVMGTLPYMSPEQVTARNVDHRSDIFSVGVLLYEMATGRRPFQGQSDVELASAILRDNPSPVSDLRPDVPTEFAAIVARCLQKNVNERFQGAKQVADALRTVARKLESGSRGSSDDSGGASTSAETGASIAVLPFQNLSANPDNEYFSDGLAEEILNALTQIDGLRVAARTSSFSFKGKVSNVIDVGAKLRVATVLDGSVRRAGSRVRVTVQLVDAANGFQLWSERYDREMADIFDVQDEIARAVTERLKLTLGEGVQRATKNLEAYELYLKGRHHWHQRSPTTLRKALQCFEQAIQLDPDYALAHAGLADCYGILRVYGWVSADEGRGPARAAMLRAMELAPTFWEVQFSRAFYFFYFEREWRDAARGFEQACATNPRSSLAQMYLGLFRATLGHGDAVTPTARASQLDPLSPFIHALSSVTLFLVRRLNEAEQSAERALELQPDYLPALWPLGLTLSKLDRHDEAIATLERAVALSRAPLYVGLLGLAYARGGRGDAARRVLRELEERAERGEFVAASTILPIHVGLGDTEAVRAALRASLAESTPPLSLRATSTEFMQPFRTDPEIDRMLFEFFESAGS